MSVHPRLGEGEESVAPPASPQIDGVRLGKQVVWSLLSVAAQNAIAATLVDDAPHLLQAWEGSDPPLGVLLHGEAPTESRLPLR